jgi:hypothetical protein
MPTPVMLVNAPEPHLPAFRNKLITRPARSNLPLCHLNETALEGSGRGLITWLTYSFGVGGSSTGLSQCMANNMATSGACSLATAVPLFCLVSYSPVLYDDGVS